MGSTVYMGRLLRISLVLLGISYAAASVSYDYRGVTINGHRKILISGAIHYPRSTPEMWPDLIGKAKAGGVDVIETYIFWNGHEPSPGNYNFQERYDLIGFLRAVQKAGLYAMVRIGPFVCAEWNFGGFPVWLKYVPRIEFRTDNEPFKAEMQKFTEKIVGMLKAENMFQPQGGPIILSQIENEYDLVEGGLGAAGKRYAYWAANMAEGLGTGVPWVMCKQADAPGAVINTWNGYYADEFYPNGHNKPRMWTENWSGWYTAFGKAVPYRPVQDVAYAVARFIGRGGSFVNYYMYHGGTNFGRTAGGPFIATSYDYDSPIDEYGLPREPKWGHLRDLHKAIKQCEPALVSADPKYTKLGDKQEVHVYWSNTACAAFLSNYDPTYPVTVTYQNMPYLLPPWSVSILPDCKTVAFNTAKVNVQASHMKMNPIVGEPFSWQSYNDWAATALDKDAVSMKWLQDQTSLTKDTTDYLWYMTKVQINSEEYKRQVLTVDSAGHVLHVFINGQYSGTAYGNIDNPKLRYSATINMKLGTNTISLLSCTMGLPNVGFKFETWNAGVLGPVKLGALDLTKYPWSYKVGLSGEKLGIFWPAGSSSVRWAQGSWLSINHPLTWYKGTLNLPAGNDPLALDMSSMGKGQIWVNGNHVGRYWVTNKAQGNCQMCNYAGTFSETKCLSNCGQASQKWYHVPRSWLMPTGNLVVVLEEIGGDPTKISLVTRTL